MRRIAFTLILVFLAFASLTAQAQQTEAAPPTVPVASRSQADCTGFIASPVISRDLFVIGGADDDFRSEVRQFAQGESIFISQPKSEDVGVGSDFSVVRPADELFLTMRYADERANIGKTGKPYEDIGQVKVTHVNPDGIVAKVSFSCGPILPGDILVPFQSRPIPTYSITPPLDHFAPLNSDKAHGRIIASHNNSGFLGRGNAVYVNLGEEDGTVIGQRLRIYKVLPPTLHKELASERTPAETVGEAIVLSVQPKSCVAMIVSSYREISAGDYIEKE